MHVATVRVRYVETDQGGVVYHANYLAWFEVGRTEWLRACGMPYSRFERERDLLLTVVDVGLRYHNPARYDDLIEIRTWLADLRRVRFRLEHEIQNRDTGERLCTGHVMLACVDRTGHPRTLPEDLTEALRRGAVGGKTGAESAVVTGGAESP
jgi:acyl-CoA thioester hydrolase